MKCDIFLFCDLLSLIPLLMCTVAHGGYQNQYTASIPPYRWNGIIHYTFTSEAPTVSPAPTTLSEESSEVSYI